MSDYQDKIRFFFKFDYMKSIGCLVGQENVHEYRVKVWKEIL